MLEANFCLGPLWSRERVRIPEVNAEECTRREVALDPRACRLFNGELSRRDNNQIVVLTETADGSDSAGNGLQSIVQTRSRTHTHVFFFFVSSFAHIHTYDFGLTSAFRGAQDTV